MKKFVIIVFSLGLTTVINAQGLIIDTILVINKQPIHFKTTSVSDDLILLNATLGSKTALIDTINSQGLAYIEFPDFNNDGNNDILVDYFGNNSTYFLYLFDPITNVFRSIKDYSNYPEAIQLKSNPKYYYSYHRAGCADMNWVSDLFKIENFKIFQLGHIYGQGCDYEVKLNPQVVEIFKVKAIDEEKGQLVEKLPYIECITEFCDKWEFIKKYWNTNYKKFE
jgi:hypothetical protein